MHPIRLHYSLYLESEFASAHTPLPFAVGSLLSRSFSSFLILRCVFSPQFPLLELVLLRVSSFPFDISQMLRVNENMTSRKLLSLSGIHGTHDRVLVSAVPTHGAPVACYLPKPVVVHNLSATCRKRFS